MFSFMQTTWCLLLIAPNALSRPIGGSSYQSTSGESSFSQPSTLPSRDIRVQMLAETSKIEGVEWPKDMTGKPVPMMVVDKDCSVAIRLPEKRELKINGKSAFFLASDYGVVEVAIPVVRKRLSDTCEAAHVLARAIRLIPITLTKRNESIISEMEHAAAGQEVPSEIHQVLDAHSLLRAKLNGGIDGWLPEIIIEASPIDVSNR